MRDIAPDSDKDNLIRTKSAIHELNNLHNGAQLLKPEQSMPLAMESILQEKKRQEKEVEVYPETTRGTVT